MKKIIVTGGAGFIGSEFIRQTVELGYSVVVLDSISYAGDKKRLRDIADNIVFYKTSISNAVAVNAVIKKEKPSIIVHFAAETHVDRSILDGQIFLKTNIIGTQVLLEAAREHGINKFVHISTDEVYGDIEKGQFFEITPFKPNSPYSVSKASADMLVSAYARTYNLPVNIIRASNNYGPWQYPEKLLPVVIYKALNNQKIPIYGKGMNIREWLFVADCARAVVAVMEKGKIGEAYNVGSGIEKRNIDVVKAVLKNLNKPETLIEFVQDRPGHDFRYSLNCDKIHKELGWKPQYDFEKGLSQTIKWYMKNEGWLNKKVSYLKDYWKAVYSPLKK
jgi:dTDP-glucose 4,6-dehydratase